MCSGLLYSNKKKTTSAKYDISAITLLSLFDIFDNWMCNIQVFTLNMLHWLHQYK